ncbi:glycosyl hydrolase family 28 protein [Paenibacillus sp. NPDC057886]|uniref:glycosyl hydrolase family 28 protein n=1 Tax=Paenibacillus sp. NPDC057886 TaxID=3346270 RepID=UPI00368B9D3B
MKPIICYPLIQEIPQSQDYIIRIREAGSDGPWSDVNVYGVKVDMHHVRQASMAYFDMGVPAELEIECMYTEVQTVDIRPLSYGIQSQIQGNMVSFELNEPLQLSIEVNGERFRNLHLFGNGLETDAPSIDDPRVHIVQPGIHRTEWLETEAEVLYFAPGMHYIEETILRIPSGKTVYIDGGAAVAGSFVCDRVQNVTIRGRGMVYLADFHRFSAFRGIRLIHSSRIAIEGIMIIDVPHYSVYIGSSQYVSVKGIKSFSTRGWSDGIDIMSSSDIEIEHVFMRNSDDCIAIYGSRWGYRGDSRRIRVRHAVLWADVAHPLMIGTHGDHEANGDVIEDIRYEDIDILEHHEPQPNYWGAMAINAGDHNTVRNVVYARIRVETFEKGQLFDLRVIRNKDYNPAPGRRIEQIVFEDIDYAGGTQHPSRIYGYDDERSIEGVTFNNLTIAGQRVHSPDHPAIEMNEYVRGITFR